MRRKLTLPLVAALSREGPEAELRAIMKADVDLDPWHISRATRLIDEAGGKELTQAWAQENHAAAVAALESVGGHSRGSAWQALREIADFSVRRSY